MPPLLLSCVCLSMVITKATAKDLPHEGHANPTRGRFRVVKRTRRNLLRFKSRTCRCYHQKELCTNIKQVAVENKQWRRRRRRRRYIQGASKVDPQRRYATTTTITHGSSCHRAPLGKHHYNKNHESRKEQLCMQCSMCGLCLTFDRRPPDLSLRPRRRMPLTQGDNP